jgi:hypothetical protein
VSESIDLSGDTPSEDPFSEVPSDPLVGTPSEPIDLSEAPEEQRLGGTDAPLVPPEEEPIEPAPGEFMEDPEEPTEVGPEADDPTEPAPDLDEQPAAQPDLDEPLPPEEGGPGYEETQHEAAAEAAAVLPEEAPEPAESPAEPETPEPPLPEPPAEPEPPPAESAKKGSPTRTYFVLEQQTQDVDPEGEPVFRERTTVVAHNGEGALRKAYRKLFGDSEEQVTMVVVPESMWKPKPVRGRTKADVSIDIG